MPQQKHNCCLNSVRDVCRGYFFDNCTTPEATTKECPPGVLSTTLEAPPEGMASFRTLQLDEDCIPIAGPIRIVLLKQLPEIAMSTKARNMVVETAEVEEQMSGVRTKRSFYAEQAVLDIINVTLNNLYGKVNFKYNGSTIRRFKASGGSFAHQENYPLTCAPGWYLGRHFNAQVGGCPGSSSASFVQYTEFGYKRFFDCTGSVYYNKLGNHMTVYANGSVTCQFTQHYRTWSVLWRWTMACY